jgi:hypothetical protein
MPGVSANNSPNRPESYTSAQQVWNVKCWAERAVPESAVRDRHHELGPTLNRERINGLISTFSRKFKRVSFPNRKSGDVSPFVIFMSSFLAEQPINNARNWGIPRLSTDMWNEPSTSHLLHQGFADWLC